MILDPIDNGGHLLQISSARALDDIVGDAGRNASTTIVTSFSAVTMMVGVIFVLHQFVEKLNAVQLRQLIVENN